MLSFARVYIEVSAEKELRSNLKVKTGMNRTATIEFEYPWKPFTCDKCKIFGHNFGNCPKNKEEKVIRDAGNNERSNAQWQQQGRRNGHNNQGNRGKQMQSNTRNEGASHQVNRGGRGGNNRFNNATARYVPVQKQQKEKVTEKDAPNVTLTNSFSALEGASGGEGMESNRSKPNDTPNDAGLNEVDVTDNNLSVGTDAEAREEGEIEADTTVSIPLEEGEIADNGGIMLPYIESEEDCEPVFTDHLPSKTMGMLPSICNENSELRRSIREKRPTEKGGEWTTVESKKKKKGSTSPGEIEPTLAMIKKLDSQTKNKKVKTLNGYIVEVWDDSKGVTFACRDCGAFFTSSTHTEKHIRKEHPLLVKQVSPFK
ncbi:hypothetical protein ACHQM5_018916 [Ranunculus cassubicifolius]